MKQERWQRVVSLWPYVLATVVILLSLGVLKAYQGVYETHAGELLAERKFEEVIARYPKAQAAGVARLRLGASRLEEGKWDEAIAWYEPLQAAHDPLLNITALHNLAFAWFKKGDSARAQALLKQAIQDPKNSMKEYSERLLAHLSKPSTLPPAPPPPAEKKVKK